MKDGYILPEYGEDLWFESKPDERLFKFVPRLKSRTATAVVERIGTLRCPSCKRLERSAP